MDIKVNGKLEINISRVIRRRGLEEKGRVQKVIDSEVLRYSDPLIPVDTHTLRRSGIAATEIGSGVVQYNTPYARKQYYENTGRLQAEPQRSGMWFERMKAQHKDDILRTVRKEVNK